MAKIKKMDKASELNQALASVGIKINTQGMWTQNIPTPGMSNTHTEPLEMWGEVLTTPTFIGVEQLKATASSLDSIHMEPIFRKKAAYEEVPERFAAVSNLTDETYEIFSDHYQPIQDAEVVQPLITVLESLEGEGHDVFGVARNIGSGRLHLYALMKPFGELTINLLEEKPQPFMVGVRVGNSYTGESGFYGSGVSVRMICCNFNIWGDLIPGAFSMKHMAVDKAETNFERLLKNVLNAAEFLNPAIKKAMDRKLDWAEGESLLYAIDLPQVAIDAVVARPEAYCPEVETMGLNVWTLQNMASAVITHRNGSATYLDRTESLAEEAEKLLTKNISDLIRKGDRLKQIAEEKKKQQELKEAKKLKLMA